LALSQAGNALALNHRGNVESRNIMIIKTVTRDRSKIMLDQEDEFKHWVRHFGVTKDELTRAVEKVGNSAAAVRKELAAVKK
jgi:pectate lyase